MKDIVHLIKYNFKILSKNFDIIIWSLVFPCFLLTIFSIAFSNLNDRFINTKSDIVGIYIPETVSEREISTKNNLSENFSEKLISVLSKIYKVKEFEDKEKAMEDLKDRKIIALVEFSNLKQPKLELSVVDYNLKQYIVKSIVDSINQKMKFLGNIISSKIIKAEKENPGKIFSEKEITEQINKIFEDEKITSILNNKMNLPAIEELNLSGKTKNNFIIISYSTLAYAIFMMIFTGNYITNLSRGDRSHLGIRIESSKIQKYKMVFANIFVSVVIGIGINTLVLLYADIYLNILEIDIIPQMLVLQFFGVMTSVLLGITFTSLIKIKEEIQYPILTVISLILSFLSGMMSPQIKVLIEKNLPILNKINPISVITDGYYSLLEYEDMDRFLMNISVLMIMSFVLLAITLIFNRRSDYDTL